jgi:hypothetical protein
MLPGMERALPIQDEPEAIPVVKDCGDCTGCCGPSSLHVPGVFGAWEQCPHSRFKRCEIYADRPNECRDYQCMWSLAPAWPPELRPDRCGFIGIFQERESRDHLDVVFCEAPPGVKPRLLGQAIVHLLTGCREAGATRITLLYGDESRTPMVEIDVPFSEVSGRPEQEVALEILGLWNLTPPLTWEGHHPSLE